MTNIIPNFNFDCTQFLSFNWRGDTDVASTITELKDTFSIIPQNEITPEKLYYLEPFLQPVTFELFNQEYGAEFGTWFERDNIPDSLVTFSSQVRKIHEHDGVHSLTVILVHFADCEKEIETRAFFGEFHISQIYDALYHASCFERSGEIVVLRFLD